MECSCLPTQIQSQNDSYRNIFLETDGGASKGKYLRESESYIWGFWHTDFSSGFALPHSFTSFTWRLIKQYLFQQMEPRIFFLTLGFKLRQGWQDSLNSFFLHQICDSPGDWLSWGRETGFASYVTLNIFENGSIVLLFWKSANPDRTIQ